MTSRRAVLPLLLLLLTLLRCSGGQLNCDVRSPDSLSGCLRQLLESSRKRLAEGLDPLSLSDRSSAGLTAGNITLFGLSDYQVDWTTADLLPTGGFALRAHLSWPLLYGFMDASVTRCRRVLIELCYKLRAQPVVAFRDASADLATTLRLTFGQTGLTFAPTYTDVRLKVSNITVTANLDGRLGELNKAFDDPASRAVTKWAGEWWDRDQWKLESRATTALDKLIRTKLAGRIGELLAG